jgi:hypothetical protein
MIKSFLVLCLLLYSSLIDTLHILSKNNSIDSHDRLFMEFDPCEEAKAGIDAANALSKTIKFDSALHSIQKAFSADEKEHVVAFGRDNDNNIITSPLKEGKQNTGIVPKVPNAFADLHNHPGNHPPDAGDLYGLLDINKKQSNYDMRFIITQNKTLYALVVTNPAAADSFNVKFPRDLTGCENCSPKFPESIVDEFREMKYGYGCTDEMALAFILEKYNAGISLLKRDSHGNFNKLRTSVTGSETNLIFVPSNCP